MLTTVINKQHKKKDTVWIAIWNSNGLNNHIGETRIFLKTNKIDSLLISKNHTTQQTVIKKIPYYTIYYLNHPDRTTHTASPLIIKSHLKHYVLEPYITNKIQNTIIKLKSITRPITIAAIYSPPKQTIYYQKYQYFLIQLTPHFLMPHNWNAKHTTWESRLTTPKGRNLQNVIQCVHKIHSGF
jgi:hypothetical protein